MSRNVLTDEPALVEDQADSQLSLGVLTGTVRSISDRPQLRLTLYDALFETPVYCYLRADQQEAARNAWGNRVSVTGLIHREANTGRPIEVRNVQSIELIPTPDPAGYKQARGLIPWREGDERAEDTIRRIRDAG